MTACVSIERFACTRIVRAVISGFLRNKATNVRILSCGRSEQKNEHLHTRRTDRQSTIRENTAKTAGSMANVTRIPYLKRCVCCKRMRTAVTGRETQAGFLCGMCGK